MKCGFQSSKQVLLVSKEDKQYFRERVSYVINVPRMENIYLMAHLRILEEDSGRQMMTESFNPIDVVE